MQQIKTSRVVLFLFAWMFITSCSIRNKLQKAADNDLLSNAALANAHVGISVFDPIKGKYLYQYQGDKYFVPASNTKLFTCYAAMKYLGDSLIGAKYATHDDGVLVLATGDPTFLHPDFSTQPLYQFLSQTFFQKVQLATPFKSNPFGRGWAWDDYEESYMAERDPFPIFGNVATISLKNDTFVTVPSSIKSLLVGNIDQTNWKVSRQLGSHFYTLAADTGKVINKQVITLPMERGRFAARYLADTLHKPVESVSMDQDRKTLTNLYSQPTDSLLSIMMHRSDNFFAEQTLMMISDAVLGEMNDTKAIGNLMNSIYKNVPQKPKWVDGSGLSRYNLFTPQDFIWLLHNMKKDFGEARMKAILPTGGEGTLSSLYKNYSGRIFAKTGTLSNHVALSGMLVTKKNKTLFFSVLVNAHQANAQDVRKAIETFVTSIIDRY